MEHLLGAKTVTGISSLIQTYCNPAANVQPLRRAEKRGWQVAHCLGLGGAFSTPCVGEGGEIPLCLPSSKPVAWGRSDQ